MPVYEYKGQFYELVETDPAAAKAKILSHLGEQAPAAPVSPPQTLAVQAGLDQRPSMPAGFMLRPEFVEQVRSEYGNLPPEQRRAALQEASMGRGIRADAAKRILADLSVEDQRRREITQGREGLMGILAAAQQQPAPRQPAAPAAGPAPRVQFPDVSPTIGDIMDMVPEQERIKRRLAQDEAARTLEAAESSIEAIADRNRTTGLNLGLVPEQFKSGLAGLQQSYFAGTAKGTAENLAVFDRIDRGETVPASEDPVGYQDMSPEQRAKVRAQFERVLPSNIAKVVSYGAEQQQYARNPLADQMIQSLNKGDYQAAKEAFLKDPLGIAQQLSVESAPNVLPSLIGGAAGVLLRGGLAGMMTGLATGSFPVEYFSSLVDSLRDANVNMKDERAIDAKLRDPEFLKQAGKKAVTRGTVIAAADALSGLVARPLRPGQLARNIGRGAVNVAGEVGLEAAGEAAAQQATGEFKLGDIVAEALGAGPQAVGTTALSTIQESRKAPEVSPPAAPPAPPVTPAPAERIEPRFEERPVPPVPGERVEPALEGAPAPSPAAPATMREQQSAIEELERAAEGPVVWKNPNPIQVADTPQGRQQQAQELANSIEEGDTIITDDGSKTGDRVKVVRVIRDKSGNVTAILPEPIQGEPESGKAMGLDQIWVRLAPQFYTDADGNRVTNTGGVIEKGTAPSAKEAKPAEVPPAQTERVKLFRGIQKGKEGQPTVGDARFMSPDRKIAEMYAGAEGNIQETEVTFNKLLDVPRWTDAKTALGLRQDQGMADIVNAARDQGYDGVSFVTTNGREYIVIPKKELEPSEPVQEAAKDALQVEPLPPQTEIPRQAVVEVPVNQLTLSEDVPQFKTGADKEGIVEALGGKFERTGVAPIQVWRRTDGRMEIISGRHRFDLAKRSGEKTIPAQIHDESKGFTRDMAAVLDAELNIRDGQGKVKDYVNYFKGTGLDRETANARGLLARAPGKRAFSIANDGSDELIAGVRADQIPDEAAYLIAINAPGDARLQSVGIKAVADGKSAATAVNMMQAVRALAGEADTTTDMFGFDDSAMKEAEEMAKIAGRKQKEIQTRLSAISGAARNPQLAASEGIDIRDPQAVNNRINELRQMKAAWDNWSVNPELIAEIRAERGAAPPVLTTQTPEELRAKAEREERARKEEQAKPAEVPPAEEFVLTGSERAADEAAARGQMELAPVEEKAEKKAEAKPGEAVDENDTGFRGASDEEVKEVAGAFKDAEQSQEDERETRVFDPPTKNEVVRIEDKVRVYTKDRGYMTLAEAKQEIAKWKQHAFEQGDTGVNANKIVLSLFDLTGEWSMPWDAAGYQVYRFDIQTDPEFGDVNKFSADFFNDIFGAFEGQDIYAILAACPCTDFASSGARHFAAKDEDGRTLESVELVRQTLATIEYFKPSVWAIENPVGRIEKLTGLPPWRSSWNPNHFGDPYTKKTLLWGRFNADMPIAPVEATEGSKMHRMYGGKSQATKNARSVTPEGFAYAFFMANNAVDNPVLAISNKYDLMDRAVFEEAVNAGMTYEEISSVVDEPYYFSRDYKQAEADLRAAAKGASPEVAEKKQPPLLPVPEGFEPKKGRKTQLVMAARELAAGRITKAEYDEYVEAYLPITTVLGGVMEPPVEDGMMTEILTKKIKQKKDPDKVNAPIADGTRVGLRMDIPALEWGKANGVNGSVVSIHKGAPLENATAGDNLSYRSTGAIKNVKMAIRREDEAFLIAQQAEPELRRKKTGEEYLKSVDEKKPQQTMEGEWVNMSPEETFRLIQQNLDNPDWVQVSLDPLRHSYFYARDSKRPVLSADEALQVGRFVLVKNPVYGEREQFLYSIDTDQPKGYDFSSQEPIAGEQSNRSPSLKRKVKTLNRQREDGKITPEKFVEEVDAAVKADEESKYDKAAAARVRGADYIRQRLLEAKRRGELSEESVNLAEWFILQNENLVGDLGIAIKTPKKGGTAGMYATLQRIMVLMKGAANDSTIVHEILHHLERMMPAEVQQAIRKAWLRSLVAAQKKAKTPEEKFFFEALMNHHLGTGSVRYLKDAPKFILMLSGMGVDTNLYDRSYRVAIEMLRLGLVKMDNYQFVNPSEFWAVNGSEIVRGRYEAVQGGVLARLKNWLKELGERIKGMFGMRSDAPLIKALDSLSKADGKFVSRDMLSSQEDYLQIGKNIYGRKPLAAWTMPDETKLDADLIYRLQNKQIDLKRAVDAIEEAAGGIEDRWDAYLQEELYHGRTARETANFLREEVRPLLEAMNEEDVSIADLEEYLHNRFAEERNIQIAKVNPAYPDDGTPFSGGSGIDTADAQAYLNNLTPEQRRKYERLAKMVDGITKGTREYLVDSGLEERSTIDSWESAAPNYVPLNRGDVEYSTTVGTGTGLGYSVRGPSSRRATGSRRTVVDILPNIIMQRERAIVRGEKNRVAVAVYGLAVQNPNSEVWLAVNPQAKTSKKKAVDELINMGLTQQDAEGLMEEPAATVVDPQTGLVTKRVNPVLRGAGNVLAARVNGQDRYVFFNTQNPRAARMVSSLKNMDADQLGTAMSLVASLTRWFASINTQYNPIFGPYNFLRDFQGAAIQLSGTELADSRAKVLSPVNIAGAMSGIYSTLRRERAGAQPATKQWADLWRDFQAQGGQTGYRDMFSRSQERAEALQREIDRMNQGVVRRGGNAIFGWLADYNETLENAVRLSAYKAGLDAGMSKERAASLAKNLTVNFNRKGQVAVQVGALYAFFNSAVQGTTRLLQTVAKMERPGDITSLRLTKAGKAVIYGGLLIGTAQAIALAAMGYDENEPPDFVKDRNLIIPIGDGKYLAWPLPLGYHVIPAIGRILTEWMIAGGKDPAKRIVHLADVILDAFNPIGNAGLSAQTIAPTIADPIVALTENRDWTGKKIAREDVSKLDPTPGYTRARENASWISRQISYYLNLASGGDKDKPGVFSPTPDQIDYLAGQVTGGLGREILKATKTTEAMITGEELAPYNIPLAGRFYGDTKAGYAESARFYKNLEELNILDNQLKGRQSRKESVTEFVKENPKLRLVESARETERNIRELRKQRKELVEKGASREAVKAKENLITNQMKRLNDQVKKLEETPKKPAN